MPIFSTVRWIPEHEGVFGNKAANRAVKIAALSKQNDSIGV